MFNVNITAEGKSFTFISTDISQEAVDTYHYIIAQMFDTNSPYEVEIVDLIDNTVIMLFSTETHDHYVLMYTATITPTGFSMTGGTRIFVERRRFDVPSVAQLPSNEPKITDAETEYIENLWSEGEFDTLHEMGLFA